MTDLLQNLAPSEQRNPRTETIDTLDTAGVLMLLNAEDQQVPQAVARAIPQIVPVVERVVEALRTGGRLLYVGAGTSGRLGVLDASECPPTFGTPPEWVQGIIAGGETALRHAVEGAEDDGPAGRRAMETAGVTGQDVVVGISASGGAAYVVEALRAAREARAYTVALTGHPQNPLTQVAEQSIIVEVGPEPITGSTRMKAGTAQKLVLNMMTTAAMVQLGKTYGNFMVDVAPSNQKLRDRARRIVMTLGAVSAERAEALLVETGYQVKPAVVMAKSGCTAEEARQRLAAMGGKLRRVLETC